VPNREIKYRQLMESSLLIRYLGNSPKLRIIDFMLYFPLNDFMKKEILEEVGMSKQTFYKHFEELIQEGIVSPTRKIAKATLYRVDREHPVVRKLEELVRETSLKVAEQEEAKIRKPVQAKIGSHKAVELAERIDRVREGTEAMPSVTKALIRSHEEEEG